MKEALKSTSEKEVNNSKLHNTIVYVRQHWQLYLLFMMPAFVLTIVFRYVPMGGIMIAFTEYNPFRGIWGSEFVGMAHFNRFLQSPDFMRYLLNTLKLSVYGLLWGFPAPILLAFLLNRVINSSTKQKIQLVLYMPNFISVIVLCGIVRILLSPTGMLNMLLGTNYNFMTMPEAFRTIYIAPGIWQGAGWASIIYTAALSNAKYAFPNVFMSTEDTKRCSDLYADTAKCINVAKSDWVMNGFKDADWEKLQKDLEAYGMPELLQINQKYFDAYIGK